MIPALAAALAWGPPRCTPAAAFETGAETAHGGIPAAALTAELGVLGDTLRRQLTLDALRAVSFELQLAAALAPDAAAPLAVTVSGTHRLTAGSGEARFEVLPIALDEDGARLWQLVSTEPGSEWTFRGQLEARGDVRWQRGTALAGGLDIALRDVDVATEAASIERLNGVVRIEPLWPPQSPPGQEIAMALVNVGLELRDGVVSFQLREDGVIDIGHASWRVAGGRVATAGPIDLAADERELALRVEAVSLAELFALATLEGLSGEGRVDGVLPIYLGAAGAEVRGGRLEASSGGMERGEDAGWIRYTPDPSVASLAESAPGFDVLLPALRDFHYRELAVELDGNLRGEVALTLRLEGANPAYRDGYPVRLNLNVDAHLADLLKAGEWVYRIPERIEAELEAFGSRAPAGAQH